MILVFIPSAFSALHEITVITNICMPVHGWESREQWGSWTQSGYRVIIEDVNSSAIYFTRQIQTLACHYQIYKELEVEKRGGYQSCSSSLWNEAIHGVVQAWLTAQMVGLVTPLKFCKGLNKEIVPGLGIALKAPLCTKTTLHWLLKLGRVNATCKKSIHMDGHKRETLFIIGNTCTSKDHGISVLYCKVCSYQQNRKAEESQPNLSI